MIAGTASRFITVSGEILNISVVPSSRLEADGSSTDRSCLANSLRALAFFELGDEATRLVQGSLLTGVREQVTDIVDGIAHVCFIDRGSGGRGTSLADLALAHLLRGTFGIAVTIVPRDQ